MTTCKCGKPTRDEAYVCDSCTDDLSRALGDVAWLDDELETTITKRKKRSTRQKEPLHLSPGPGAGKVAGLNAPETQRPSL